MFYPTRVPAERCLELGIFNRVVPDAMLAEQAFAMASELANGPSSVLGLIKDNLNDASNIDFLESLDREAERMIQSAATADHKEAVQAFVEKRPARFTGR